MMKQKVPLYQIFNSVFAALFLVLIGIVVFAHNNPFLSLKKIPLIGLAALLCAGFAVLAMLWHRYGQAPQRERLIVGLLLAGYLAVQVVVGLQLQVIPRRTWDFPMVFYQAQQFVLEGTAPDEYFALFDNNAPLYWLFVGLFTVLKPFGVQDFMPAAVVCNCLLINVALLYLYRTARLLWGPKWALAALVAAFCCPALVLYGPIVYTDTLTLPAVTISVYHWLRARGSWAEQNKSGARRHAAAAGAAAAVGTVLKVSVAILFIAYCIDLVLLWQKKQKHSVFLCFAACFLILLAAGNWASRAALPEYQEEGVPFTHWIMMGLQGDGGYWDPDYKATLSYDTYAERAAFHRAEIRARLAAMTPAQLMEHCANKLSYIVSDGTYYAPVKLDQGPKRVTTLHTFIVPGSGAAGMLYYAADALQLCLLLGCMLSALRAVVTKQHQLTVLRVAVFGCLLFLLIWEARSRYLLNFWPLLLLCAVSIVVPETVRLERQNRKAPSGTV